MITSSQKSMGPLRGKKRRARIFTGVLVLMFICASLSQTRLQLLSSDKILQYAQETKRFRVRRTETARRGSVYSSDGKILAQSTDAYELGINLSKVPKSSGFYMELGTATQVSPSDLAQAATSGIKTYILPQPLNAEAAERVKGVKSVWSADGVSLRKMIHREYPFGEATACILGNIRDQIPVAGLEKSYDKILGGQNGIHEGIVDRTGAFLLTHPGKVIAQARNGEDIVLTIDSYLQVVATQAIKKAVEIHKADSGVAIVMQPETGDILAMANWPSYNPTLEPSFSGQASEFNLCYMGSLTPGSIFKPLTLIKGIDKGVVDVSSTIDCKGELSVSKGCKIHCGKYDRRRHGSINAVTAIARSCNVSTTTWAMRIGYQDMVKYLKDLGFLEKTEIGLPLGARGLFNHHDYAKNLQLANVSFGQSFTATPIALCSAFSILANKGVRMHPRLIKSIGGKTQPIRVAGQIVKPESAEIGLRTSEMVFSSEGNGKRLHIKGYRLAGKTGTAERVNPETGSLKGGGYAPAFMGIVPATNPKAVILTMVDNPKSGFYYGATVAGPAFRQIAEAVIRYNKIPPTEPLLSPQLLTTDSR